MPTDTFYVEPPTIPIGMSCQEYRRHRAEARPRPLPRRLATRVRRTLRA